MTKTIGVVARPDLREARAALVELLEWLRQQGAIAYVEERTAALVEPSCLDGCRVAPGPEVAAQADALVVLGGDGTLLGASQLLEGRPLPVLAVNFGSLGFLTEVALPELIPAMASLLAGSYRSEERRMLRAAVHREQGAPVVDDALNDVVVTKASLSRIIELDVSVDGAFVSSFRADGLIVSSPTGSTAYNLAAGGPILHPALSAVVVTPICPHMLTYRPLVVGDQAVIEVRLRGDGGEAYVTFDGQRGFAFGVRDRLSVTRSPRTLRLVKAPGRDYFEVLRTKLKWGEPTSAR